MKNKITLLFLVVSLSTMIDPILAGNNIPSKNGNVLGTGSHKPLSNAIPPKQTETEFKKNDSYVPALIIFGCLILYLGTSGNYVPAQFSSYKY